MTVLISPTTNERLERPGFTTRASQVAATFAVLVVLVGAIASIVTNVGTTPYLAETKFGCAGTMVISNVDCEMGSATAYGDHKSVAASDLDLTNGLAPWCRGQNDQTVYGCAVPATSAGGTDVAARRALMVSCHQRNPSLHPDGMARAVEATCDAETWIGELLVDLEQNRVLTQACLERVRPDPVCIP